jgi:hypothetical protein
MGLPQTLQNNKADTQKILTKNKNVVKMRVR